MDPRIRNRIRVPYQNFYGSTTLLVPTLYSVPYSAVCRGRRATSGRRGAVPELWGAAPAVAGGRHHARPLRHQVGDPRAGGRRHQTLRLHGAAAAATAATAAAAAAATARVKTEHARRGIVVDTIPVIK